MDWMALLENITHAVITAVIPIITYFLAQFLRAKYKEIVGNSEIKYFRNTLDEVLDLILSVVNSTSQTYVDNLKKDGVFDANAQAEAFRMTRDTVLDLLSSEAMDVIETIYGDLDTWINIQIENAVRRYKLEVEDLELEQVEG